MLKTHTETSEPRRPGSVLEQKPSLGFLKQVESNALTIIETPEQFTQTKELVAVCKQIHAETKNTYDEMLVPLNKRRSIILEWKRADLEHVKDVDRRLTESLNMYVDLVEKRQEEEATKALEEAESKALSERQDEVSTLYTMADLALEEGKQEDSQVFQKAAEDLESSPSPPLDIVPVTPHPEVKEPSPVVSVRRYRGQLQQTKGSKLRLVKAVASGKVPEEALKINDVWVNSYARQMKEDFDLPGFELMVDTDYKRKAGGK